MHPQLKNLLVLQVAIIITLPVSLPVGVVIGLMLPSQAVRRCVGRVCKLGKLRGRVDKGDIYKRPDQMAVQWNLRTRDTLGPIPFREVVPISEVK